MAKFKILKTGETDINSTDIWRFCVHSDYPTQKVYSSGQTTLTIPLGSNVGSKTISHSLGYDPIVMAMFGIDNNRLVKVLGETKASITAQQMQFFAVDVANDYIVAKSGYGPGAPTVDSFVSINDIIRFTAAPGNLGILPSPLQPNTNYYVVSIISSTTFKISTTLGGSPVNITDGGGTYADIFSNITDPYTSVIDGTYKVKTSSSNISFEFNPVLTTPLLGADKNITIYYIILYDEI